MRKYIDAEKLVAEIERLHKAHSGKYGRDEVAINLEHLEDFITSLQQEQPEVDLKKEVDKFLNETGAPYFWCNDNEQLEWCSIIARHFFKLGLNARKEE